MELQQHIRTLGEQARVAAQALISLNVRKRNAMLDAMADALDAQKEAILEANARDLARVEAEGLGAAVAAQLRLSGSRIQRRVRVLRDISALQSPVGVTVSRWLRPNGLEIIKKRVPIGVIALIYEPRPTVTVDAVALCLKTSNAIILRGGHAASETNAAIADALIAGGSSKGMPAHAVQLVRTPDYQAVRELLQLEGLIDLAIPRGGQELMQAVAECARVPVIKQFTGVCHVYVDADADLDMAAAIVVNAKCDRPDMANAAETLVVHRDIAAAFLPRICKTLMEAGVTLYGDAAARTLVSDIRDLQDGNWRREYLGLSMAVKVVDSLQDAVTHINTNGTHHSDAIITGAEAARKMFVQEVDSAVVYVNASTRFTDGSEFGMGAEIGVSTEKLHARGPVGLQELTTCKYIVNGSGQVRNDPQD